MMNFRAVLAIPGLLALAVACGGQGQPQATARSTGTVTVASTPSVASTPPATPRPRSRPTPSPGGERELVAGRYQPLWPFASLREARDWQVKSRPQGHQPWHLDAAFTAVAFTQGYLGFTEIDQAISTRIKGRHARVTVGFRSQESEKPLAAAVIHLVRYGTGASAPWEVVGTDDTTLTLTTPRYGSAVGSPVTAGGRITGVDESIGVRVHQPWSDKPLGEVTGLPAGGEKQPWSAKVAFTGKRGHVATIVAFTGGHVAEVERFAVTGVTVPARTG